MALNPNPSTLDQQQIVQRSFDGDNDRLRVDAEVTAVIGDVTIDASDSSIAIKSSTTGDELQINADGSIDTNVEVDAADGDNILVVGSEDGLTTGVKRVFVNNKKLQILSAQDRESAITWADFGTKNERITRIDYTSTTFSGNTARKDFSYTLSGSSYRLDSIDWSLI